MVWYNEPKVQEGNYLNYCYCELLITANDLMLQGWLANNVDNSWIFKVVAYDSTGTNIIADLTSYFDYYTANDTSGNPFFTARLRKFPPEICSQCFILNVQLYSNNVFAFNQWTDIYCIGSCCEVPNTVVITDSSGRTIPYSTDPIHSTDDPDVSHLCLNQIVRLEGVYDCEDYIGGWYYGIPASITGGNYTQGFSFRKISNIEASFRRGKREITKEIAFNCKTQKTTSVRNYTLQSYALLPEWKVEELEDILCAPYINIDGENYLYYGGDDPFVLINPKECSSPLYKFNINFKDCSIWQIFGCTSECKHDTVVHYGFMKQADAYYNENGSLIGLTINDVENYLASQNGTYSVTEENPPVGNSRNTVSNPYYKIIKVMSKGPVQSYIYENNTAISSRVYASTLNESNPDYNSLFNFSSCAIPQIGDITFTDVICATPVVGLITYADGFNLTGTVQSYGDWIVDSANNSVVRNDYQVTMSFTTTNPNLIMGGQEQSASGIIGMIDNDFAPSQQRTISSNQNPSIPEGGGIIIDTNGTISYIGTITGPDPVKLIFTNLTYPI